MNVKKNRSWLLLILSIILSIIFIFWSGVKNISGIYGIALLIFSVLPIIPAILLTAKVRISNFFSSGKIFIMYLIWIAALGFNYKLQSWVGILFVTAVIILFFLLGMIVALLRTLRSRKNSKYYFTEEEHNKISEYDSFGKAYKKYLSYTLVEGMWDALITVLIPW